MFYYTFLLLLVSLTVVLSEKSCDEIIATGIRKKVIKDSLNQVKVSFPKCRDVGDTAECGRRSTAFAHLDLAVDVLEGLQGNDCPKCPDPIVGGGSGPVDCLDILNMGYNKSGVYTIYPKHFEKGSKALQVYCDMDTDGGGWTVLQRRGNFSVQTNFYQEWNAYKNGFGILQRDFWLGNEKIFILSNQAVYSLRIDVKKADGEYRYEHHDIFFITDEESQYSLFIKDFTGNVSNGLYSQHLKPFSTVDRPNQGLHGKELCAVMMHGAWWYPPVNTCGHMSLNGLYMPGIDNRTSAWHWTWTGFIGILSSEMKIRRRNYKPLTAFNSLETFQDIFSPMYFNKNYH